MSTLRTGILSLLITIPLLLTPSAASAERPLRFAPLPMEGREILHEQFFGLVGYLQNAIGRPILLVNFDDYNDLLQAFRRDEVDLAYLGPLPYALLRGADEGVEPLACFREADGESRYTCSLVAMGESQIDLTLSKGLHIGLPQPLSTCGRLAAREILQSAGRSLQDPEIRFTYAGSHTKAALGVVRGDYDLAVVKTAIASRYRHLDLRRLVQSRSYPGFAIYANQRLLKAQEIEQMRAALLRLDPRNQDDGRVQLSSWGGSLRNGAVAPELCGYKQLLDAIGELPSLEELQP